MYFEDFHCCSKGRFRAFILVVLAVALSNSANSLFTVSSFFFNSAVAFYSYDLLHVIVVVGAKTLPLVLSLTPMQRRSTKHNRTDPLNIAHPRGRLAERGMQDGRISRSSTALSVGVFCFLSPVCELRIPSAFIKSRGALTRTTPPTHLKKVSPLLRVRTPTMPRSIERGRRSTAHCHTGSEEIDLQSPHSTCGRRH